MTNPLVAVHTPATVQQFLSFQLPAGLQAILPITQLTEVLRLAVSQIVPIPDVPPAIVGVCNWRGEVLWLADLGCLLNTPPLFGQEYHHSHHSVIVTQYQGTALGLLVSQVDRMVWCNPAQFQPIPASQAALQPSPHVQGYWLTPEGKPLLVLNSESLVNQFHT